MSDYVPARLYLSMISPSHLPGLPEQAGLFYASALRFIAPSLRPRLAP